MLTFNNITANNKDEIVPLLTKSDFFDCNFLWANLCGWQQKYHLSYVIFKAEESENLIVREVVDNKTRYIIVGHNTTRSLLDALLEDAGDSLVLYSCSAQLVDQITSLIPNAQITIRQDDGWNDYLYETERLATLTGKRYQPKRNHVNQFRTKYPQATIQPLQADDFGNCLALAKHWMESELESQGDEQTNSLLEEMRFIEFAFANFNTLMLEGVTVKVDNELVAFSFGAPLSSSVFNVCIEKANRNFVGSYAVVNQAMAQSVSLRFTYINREEDLGITGLRHAKQSYYPCSMVEKYEVTIRNIAR